MIAMAESWGFAFSGNAPLGSIGPH
jgi:hypothetical protein